MAQTRKDQSRGGGFLLAAGIIFYAACQFSTAIAAEIPLRPSQWEATLEAAKREGKVNIYMYRYGKVLDVFRSDHPEIRPYLLTGTGAQITTKILAERRAGGILPTSSVWARQTIGSCTSKPKYSILSNRL